MKKKILLFSSLLSAMIWHSVAYAQDLGPKLFQVKGFCINAPNPQGVDRFVKFINEELAPRGVNTLLLLVDYNYQFESYPQLSDSAALARRRTDASAREGVARAGHGRPADRARRASGLGAAMSGQFAKTAVRVLGVQVVTLLLLWLLQSKFSY